jgi:hypothetical protein
MRTLYTTGRRFSSLEIAVNIILLALSVALVYAVFNLSRKSAHDSERIASLYEVQGALELYFNKYGEYPEGDGLGANGWDTPGNGTFLFPLVREGFIPPYVHDPVADTVTGNFRYQRFSAGSFDCPAERGAFYVLGVENMEWDFRARHISPGWKCGNHDWSDEMEFVVGKFEK